MKRMHSAITFILAGVVTVCLVSIPVMTDSVDALTDKGIIFTVSGDDATVTSAVGGIADLVIPEYLESNGKSYKVVGIGYAAFKNNAYLETLVLPESLESISQSAFEGCTKLSSVTLPQEVSIFGSNAFKGCISLREVSLPEITNSIGTSTFEGCTNLESVNLGGINSITSNTFKNCTNLKSVTGQENLTTIGSSAFYNCKSMVMKIPEKVEIIGSQAFYGSGITELVIGDQANTIGDATFMNCRNLVSVTISNPETVFGTSVFRECSSLKTIKFPDGVDRLPSYMLAGTGITSFSIPDSVTHLGDGVFQGCQHLENVSIPSEIEDLSSHLFDGCSSLIGVDLPEGITKIPSYLLYGCKSVVEISIPDSVVEYEEYCFAGTGIEKVQIDTPVIPEGMYRDCQSLSIIEIGSSVEDVSENAFRGCTSLKNLVIPENVEYVSEYAFAGCTSLSTINIEGSETRFASHSFQFPTDKIYEVIVTCDKEGRIDHTSDYVTSTFVYLTPGKYLVRFEGVNEPADRFFYSVSASPGDIVRLPFNAEYMNYDFVATVDGKVIENDYFEMTEGDKVVYLNYSPKVYTATFMVDDEVYYEVKVPYGELIPEPPNDPYKEPTAQYTFHFRGWSGYYAEIPIRGDVTYDATFREIVRSYVITFISMGQVVSSTGMNYGDKIVPPDDPYRPPDGDVNYVFTGWEGYTEGMTVTGNATFTARFNPVDHLYTITFVSDGKEVSVLHLEYGAEISVPTEEPIKESVDGVNYVFTGWNGYTEGMTVTGDMTFEAVFDEVPQDDGGDSTWLYVTAVIIVILIVLAVLVLRKHF